MYFEYDLTGQNVLYKTDNDIRLIITADQKIEFSRPVYADSIQMTLLGTINRTMLVNVDWAVAADDIDYSSMAEMQLIDDTFDKILVKSITIIKPYAGYKYKIGMVYQSNLPVISKIVLDPTKERLDVSPELILDMVETIRRHELLLAPVKDIHTIVETNPLLLEVDLTMENTSNFIQNEIHLVNVPEGISSIHPIGGAYYGDSLKVYSNSTGALLVEGEDYVKFGSNLHKTKLCSVTSGVYEFILLKKAFVGEVKIDYHAFGGDPTLNDIRALYENQDNMLDYLVNAEIMTASTVGDAPSIVLMRNKILQLEEEMRRLIATGRPSYGDMSNGRCLKKRIAADDTALHWWTIAKLFKVEGSDQVVLSDTMKLRFTSLLTQFAFDAIVNVNITNPTNKLNVTCLSATYPKGYVPFEDYSELENIIRPQFRIIWNENTVEGSGIYLQVGLRLKTVREETIAVEDWSGNESCWILIPDPEVSVLPEDDTLTLPSGNHVWDTMNPDSRQVSYMTPFPDGHIVWAGSEALNRPNSGWKNFTLVHLLEDDTDIKNIRKIRIDLEEVGANNFPITLDVVPGSENLVGSGAFTYNGKPAYINAMLTRNQVTKKLELSVNADITAGPTSNQLNMRHVLIFL